VEVVALLYQGRTAAAQCGLFTHKSVPVIFEPPCISGSPRFKHWLRVERIKFNKSENGFLLVPSESTRHCF